MNEHTWKLRGKYLAVKGALSEYKKELEKDGHLFEMSTVEFLEWAIEHMQEELEEAAARQRK